MHKFMKFAYKSMYVIGVFSLVASVALSAAVTVAQASPNTPACTGSGNPRVCSYHRHETDGSCTGGTENVHPSNVGSWTAPEGYEAGECHTVETEPEVCDNIEADNHGEEGECVFTRINICHANQATSSPYGNSADNLPVASVANAHMGHTGPVYFDGILEPWGDIIPPFTYKGVEYSLNWNTEGMAIWNNGCQLPGEEPEDPVLGCTDSAAVNYNSEATEGNDEADHCAYIDLSLFGEACEQVNFRVTASNLEGLDLGGWSYEVYEDGNPVAVDFGGAAAIGNGDVDIAINPAVVGQVYTLYVWLGDTPGALGDAYKSLVSDEVTGCPSTEVTSLTDPSEMVCEEVSFVIENDGLVEIVLVTWQVYNSNNDLVDTGTIDNFAAGAQIQVLVQNATPGLTYTLYAWIGSAGDLGDADSFETSGVVEECEEPGDPEEPEITTQTLIPVTGVSGVLIPVTGFDAAGQAAFLATMAANMGFGSLGAGMLLHGLSLRKNKKK